METKKEIRVLLSIGAVLFAATVFLALLSPLYGFVALFPSIVPFICAIGVKINP